MPDEKPDPSVPAAPTGPAGSVAWFLRFFSGMTAEKMLVLVLLAAVCWSAWNGEEKAARREASDQETLRELRRDKEAAEEKYREHTLNTIKLCNTACADQDKMRRAESSVHMKEAMTTLEGQKAALMELRTELGSLRASIDKLGKKVP